MNLTKALRNFYEYIRTGKPDNELTERIHSAVIKGRKNKEWRSAYMKDIARLMDAREEGREEGRAEGREEGRVEGREEERKNTERERERANKAEARIKELEAILADK